MIVGGKIKLILFEDKSDEFGEIYDYIMLLAKYFSIRWFKEYGEWFLYFQLGNIFCRFSSSGFITGKNRDRRYINQ